MRTFDLNIRLPTQKQDAYLKQLYQLEYELGFAGIALDSFQPSLEIPTDTKVRIIPRITLNPRSAARLRQHATHLRKQTELLVLRGRTKPLCLAATEIPAIDMVMLTDIEDFMVIDSQIARALAINSKPVEICLHELLSLTGSLRSRLMRAMGLAIMLLTRANCSLVLTSGASNLWEVRAPSDLVALSYLAGLPEDLAKLAMFHEPLAVLSRTMSKTETSIPRIS